MASKLLARQAVVVGAGMAGLAAARVLADYFEHVHAGRNGRDVRLM